MIKQAIIKEMELHNHSVAHLARICNVSYPTMFNFIKGNSSIKLYVLDKLCELYNLKLLKTY